jgi:3-dehydroquinate synthase
MKTIHIQGIKGDSIIRIGEAFENFKKYVPVENVVIVTDPNVAGYYQNRFPPYEVIQIGVGERVKTLDTVQHIYEQLLHMEADRSWFMVGIGGGIVCDIAGFAASTFMRGIRFGFVSTTLLSQVDASVGGKNGVNFEGYKNIVGVFNQPEFVICDMTVLKTVPHRDLLCGFAEIVKHGAVADGNMFSYLEESYQDALSLDPDIIEKLVYDSVVIKSAIVNRDERESGERKKLNFGHTFGHSIEAVSGVPHGEAVSVGMVLAAKLSEARGYLIKRDVERIESLLKNLKLPTELPIHKKEMLDALKKDKKRKGDCIDFVLLQEIGRAILEQIPIKELEQILMKW